MTPWTMTTGAFSCLMVAQDGGVIDSVGKLGVGGVFAILVIQMVLNFLKQRNGNAVVTATLSGECSKKLDDLHSWHFGAQPQGMRRPDEAIRETNRLIQTQLDVLKQILAELKKGTDR